MYKFRLRITNKYIVSMHRNVLFMVKSHEVYTWPLTSRIVNTFVQNISDLGKQNTMKISLFLKTIPMSFLFYHIIQKNKSKMRFNIWAIILRKLSKKEVKEAAPAQYIAIYTS